MRRRSEKYLRVVVSPLGLFFQILNAEARPPEQLSVFYGVEKVHSSTLG